MTANANIIYHTLFRQGPEGYGHAIRAAVSAGMIAKDDLKDGVEYAGHCRNASKARWDAANHVFVYQRTKFGSTFNETIEHPEDDRGYDIFVPVAEISTSTERTNEQLCTDSSIQDPDGQRQVPDRMGKEVSEASDQVPEEPKALDLRRLTGQRLDA